MKDTIGLEQKAIHVLKCFFLFIFLGGAFISQAQNSDRITDEEYAIINTVFLDNPNDTIFIYNKIFSDKGWANYFDPKNFESLTSKVGIPTTISDTELRDILTDDVLFSIYESIYSSKPLNLSNEKLNKPIFLTTSFDKPLDLKKGVQRISKPILIGDIAVFRKIGFSEAPIHILKKKNNEWKIIYTFYDWLILE